MPRAIRMNPLTKASAQQIAKLSTADWCASYSGGKDSSALVAWIEWLRRSGQLTAARPMLVQSNTTVEDDHLQAISTDMMAALRSSGWECAVVEPRITEKLYNRILGIGNTPIHPGGRFMRWFSRRRQASMPGDRLMIHHLQPPEVAIPRGEAMTADPPADYLADALTDIEIHFAAFVRGLASLGVHRKALQLDEVVAKVDRALDADHAVVEATLLLSVDPARRRDAVTKLRRLADYVEHELEFEV